jgi:AraC-like DNA-binding protein
MSDLGSWKELARLFEYVPGTQFWIKDRESRFLACNQAFAAHFGLAGIGDLEGRTDLDFSPHHLACEYINDDRNVIASGKVMAEKMELVREKDDSLNWYATTKTPIRDAHGAVVGTAGFTRKVKRVDGDDSPARGMDRAIGMIHAKYWEALTIPGLAELAGMSVDNFERKFRNLLRETPLKYLNRVRMRAACGLLLHTQLSVGEIARQAGFSDQSYFSKRFFAHLRIKPIEYRRKYGKRNLKN